ncbi:hypothetical protein [Paenibacillus xylanexedens]|uniref:hypothetical protein n=1 Tax=Paenibacillus xylanexedens TaxID=528191 RepID=UPI000F531837|nr:hypothetical protein [Paenibacillus xylanexedens]RPK24003.1 hypothetical protein EDO6_04941 [Paenibacillus xylanexedens]
MREEDNLFEQIMKLKRVKLVQGKFKHKPKKPNVELSELEIRYNKLIAESVDRRTSQERVIQIRRELKEMRKLKKNQK